MSVAASTVSSYRTRGTEESVQREEWNWAGNYRYEADRVVHARTIEEVQEAVASADRVRALGTRHSFNDLADGTGTLLTVTSIDPAIAVDESARTVTAGAGIRYGVVAAELQSRGWALHNMGSLPHISVAGAISTGTHGSGDLNGSLSTAVRGLELVTADGSRRWVRQGDPEFPGSVVALGALGIVVRVALAIEPSYLVRQDEYRGFAWDDVLADIRALTGAGHSVSIFTDWVSPTVGHAWVKRRVADAAEPVPAELLGATRVLDTSALAAEPNLTEFGTVGPWSERLPHFRLDRVPSVGDEIQTEYFVDMSLAPDALRAVRALGPALAPHLVGTELRTVAADQLWLSPAFGRASLGIHFTWKKHPAEVLSLLPRIERALEPFSARPHWGKLHAMSAGQIRPLYPEFAKALELMRAHDPQRKFWNDHLERTLGEAP